MFFYPGITVLERAQNAVIQNPGNKSFMSLYEFARDYRVSYTKKNGKNYTGHYGVDGAVKAFAPKLAKYVVR
jgi:hypothetical protein